MIETLDTVKPGHVCKVVSLGGNNILKNRLLCMGVTPGTWIEVVKVAPLGDPMALKVRRYMLLIRKKEASGIVVEAVQLKNDLLPSDAPALKRPAPNRPASDVLSSNTSAAPSSNKLSQDALSSNKLSLDALSSNKLSWDALSSNKLSWDALSSNIPPSEDRPHV